MLGIQIKNKKVITVLFIICLVFLTLGAILF